MASKRTRKETSRSQGKSKAALHVLEHLIKRYNEKVSHYEIVSLMHLPPFGIKRQDLIENHIRELEGIGIIESSYIKSDSTSIKVYGLKDDEDSRMKVLLEIMESPNRMELFGHRYFRDVFSDEKISKGMDEWNEKGIEKIMKKGLSEVEKEEELVLRDHFDDIVRLVKLIMGRKENIQVISSMPILAYMVTNDTDGATTFLRFLEEIHHNYPELFYIDKIFLNKL